MKRHLIICWALAALGYFSIAAAATGTLATAEQRFDTLTIGTQTYSNVTVTTRNKNYVFLLHSAGMVNVKVADLSEGEKALLGYPSKLKPATNTTVAWAKEKLKKIEVKPPSQALAAMPIPREDVLRLIKPYLGLPLILGVGAFCVLVYFFFSYCSKLICIKAGSEPGFLIWVPVLQMLPLFRAAGMSPVWFIATLLPILNIIAHVVWCFRIAKARGKSVLTAICLLLPITNFFAFLYLAFSNGAKDENDERDAVITLGAAGQTS